MDLRRFEKMPPVGAAMTPFPYFAEESESLDAVAALMAEHAIHHVPVVRDGKVVGMISEKEIRVHRATPGACARDVLVPDPYVVEMHTPLADVVSAMAERRDGSAIVVKKGKLAGILSITDVCRVLATILRERFEPGDGDDAA